MAVHHSLRRRPINRFEPIFTHCPTPATNAQHESHLRPVSTLIMSSSISGKSAVKNPETDLPPERDQEILRSVSPPLSNVPLSRFNYIFSLLAVVIAAFYVWRLMQWKTDVGGWWNLALGRQPIQLQNRDADTGAQTSVGANPPWFGKSGDSGEVEKRIEELAVALGIPSTDLANAIAGAVRDHIPPASLSSVAAHETG